MSHDTGNLRRGTINADLLDSGQITQPSVSHCHCMVGVSDTLGDWANQSEAKHSVAPPD